MSEKPLRADARRNRERVLAAADAVFAAHGTAVSTEQVAREAGVGIGTVFRHFPTKEALLEAVLLRRLGDLVDRARSLAGADEPGEALFGYLGYVVERSAAKIAFADAVAAAGIDVHQVAGAAGRELLDALAVLLRRAQESGEVRGDVEPPEVHALVVGVSRAAELAGWDERVTERSLAIVFDGLRATGGARRT